MSRDTRDGVNEENDSGICYNGGMKSGYGDFDTLFPITARVVVKLESVDDGIERPREVYAGIIASAEDALREVKEYKIS